MPDLGPCCICGGGNATSIIMLDFRCAVPGHGWGCVICDLPPDGASAVLCEPCTATWQADPSKLTVACRGWPAIDGRIPIDELSNEWFGHDATKHGEEV